MNQKKFDWKKTIVPGDSLTFVTILIGMLIAIFIDEIAVRLIGVCISLLGIVALAMQISRRWSSIVESSGFKSNLSATGFTVTVKKDNDAKRQVIEDFDNEFGPDPVEDLKSDEEINYDDQGEQDDGFTILTKTGGSKKPEDDIVEVPVVADSEPDIEPEDEKKGEFSDELSGMKILSDSEMKIKQDYSVDSTLESKDETDEVAENVVKDIDEEENKPEVKQIKIDRVSGPEIKVATATENKNDSEKEINDQIDNQTEIVEDKPKSNLDVSTSIFMEQEPVFGQGPRKEFEYFLTRVLMIIRSVTSTRTAAFMLYDQEKNQLVLESYVTDLKDSIIDNKKIKLADDIVSQIVKNVKPEILSEINPAAETELIPYYKEATGAASFIGVPVFYKESVVGIICADSKFTNAYVPSIVGFLGHFTKLIGGLVHSYTDKYDLLQASKTLELVNQFNDYVADKDADIDDIAEAIVHSTGKLFDFVKTGVCCFNEDESAWQINVISEKNTNESTSSLGRFIDFDNSVIGNSIQTRSITHCASTENVIRLHPGGTIPEGHFTAIPLLSGKDCYGAFFIESKTDKPWTSYDLEILKTIGEHAGAAIEKMFLNRMLEKSCLEDNKTGLLNSPAFFKRINEEYTRSSDFDMPFTICLIQIDKYISLDPESHRGRSEQILLHVLNLIRKKLRTYDAIGREESNIFGIGLVGSNIQDAKIWAEKLRSEIAISVMEYNDKRFTVTVSIGLAESRSTKDAEELISNSAKVLNMSVQKTNCVTAFN
ncbi:MAG: GAF domain-containing protein [Candidatus Kapabacteria bacterium]|jgi:diguanylate cyclase (GGDEF)-like protein|nr:GAF domain-containing protein [Candidatus Kapabacteria bacterium]